MPVTKQNTGRVVAAPARCKRYNIPDSEMKGLGLRVEPARQNGGGHKAWYVQAMAGGVSGILICMSSVCHMLTQANARTPRGNDRSTATVPVK